MNEKANPFAVVALDMGCPSRVAASCWDGTVRVFDLDRGDLVGVAAGHEIPHMALALTPDGRELITGSERDPLRAWDLATSSVRASLTSNRGDEMHGRAVWMAEDGSYVLAGMIDGLGLYTFPLPRASMSTIKFGGAEGSVTAITAVPGGDLYTGSSDGWVSHWQPQYGDPRHTFDTYQRDGVAFLAVAADQSELVTVGPLDTNVRIWSPNGRQRAELDFGHGDCLGMALSHTTDRLYIGAADGYVAVFDRAARSQVGRFDAHDGSLLSLVLSRDERYLVTGGDEGAVKLWDPATGALLHRLQVGAA